MLIASKYRLRLFPAFIAGVFVVLSCNSTKYVPENKYLLNSVKINIDNKSVKKDELKGYIKQKSNKKILGLRFHLGLYNLSNLKKEKGINNYLRTIGEEPSVWEPYSSGRTVDQLKLYMEKKGYFNSVVIDSMRFRKKKVDLIYFIKANQPYTIRNIGYELEDTNLRRILYSDTINSLVKRKNNTDEDVFNNERIRLEYIFKDSGYYNFSKDYIWFLMDTAFNHKADIILQVKNYGAKLNNNVLTTPHKKFIIRNVSIVNESDGASRKKTQGNEKIDTVFSNGVNFLYKQNFSVKPAVILQSCYIVPGNKYRISDVDETRKHLYSLNVFSIVDIQFSEVPHADTIAGNYIDCRIKLQATTIQSNTLELEGTNSSGNLGGALNMVYQHRSLFGNAEAFNLKFRGAVEAIKRTDENKINKTIEYGVEASINFPKFLLPVNSIKFVKKYNPKTAITLAYNFQQRPDYTRTIANTSFGYNWKQGKFNTHYFIPIEMNYIDILSSDKFKSEIKGTYLENSYTNHLVTASRYTLVYNTQKIKKQTDFTFLKFNFESAGNILSATNYLFNGDTTGGYYRLFSNRYSQYLQSDVDYRYYHFLDYGSSIVFRFFAGLAVPYGNSVAVPFEKQYFSGGANSIRGWQVRTLGPGSYKNLNTLYPNSTGDIKLETNIEYRFNLFWILKGALFTDIGNVWAVTKSDEREGALFKPDKFLNDLAVGSGLGIRFDLKFFLFRTDLGLKLRDPSLTKNKWIFAQRNIYASDFALSIAINYPF